MMDENGHYWQELDQDNHDDLRWWTTTGVLVGIVDEDAGGIVAYCHRDLASRIVQALRDGY